MTQFLLRHRDPTRYGRWRDGIEFRHHPDGPALLLARATDRVALDADAREAGLPLPNHPAFPFPRHTSAEAWEAEAEERRDEAERARRDAIMDAEDAAEEEAMYRAREAEKARTGGDVASTSSTSGDEDDGGGTDRRRRNGPRPQGTHGSLDHRIGRP